MADRFLKQARQYSEARPRYPQKLFDFIASKTPTHDLVWDIGTGSGQAATSISIKQLEFAPRLPNVDYKCTSPNMSMSELEEKVGTESSVDLVTIAQAIQWFDLDTFYNQVKWILKKPSGIIAAWCYPIPKIDDEFDPVFQNFYLESQPYSGGLQRGLVDDKYTTLEFPFGPVDGCHHTGPFEFQTNKLMSLGELFLYIRSWSTYQTAKDQGVELLNDGAIEELTNAWKEDGNGRKSVTFPVYLRIGKVGGSFTL
ncbi:hypothetical protein L1987_46991 [Smallanthus sonchifolius]|uniref:Uncharacterized protein n=1 Tax=Smallanthus sonchifolius TaxID=185202 RepID=A0ACB9G1D6_9ASTR|nr:hypothetical protein L1987_46991 [Smallanthus sonchifolius]